MSKDNIGSIFEKNKNIFSYEESRDFILPRSIIGVEVELENMKEASRFASNGIPRRNINEHFHFDSETNGVLFGTGYWNVKSDGSLRNDGVEFVTKKLFGKDLAVALDELEEYLNDEAESLDDIPSDRCSIHIHLDVTDLDKNEYARLLVDYAIFESVLFNYCGVNRKENLYCLPFARSDDFKRTLSNILTSVSKDLEFKKYVNSFPKYSALNLNATSKYGSLEFRLHGGTYDMLRVKEWINIVMCLKKNCIGNSADNLHREISRFGISNYLEKVFGKYYRALDYPNCESDVIDGIRLAQDILLYNGMKESCRDYFKNHSVLSSDILEHIANYEIPHPLDKYISRIESKVRPRSLKGSINNFLYGNTDYDEPSDEEDYDEQERYEEDRDDEYEEEYYDEE
jgi:hypothetical protein